MSLHTGTEFFLDSPARLKAVANDTRARILTILEDGPASAKQLSEMLEMSHGKVGHHVKVLRETGLIEVVEERAVRAVTERLYGLTYDRLRLAGDAADRLRFALNLAARQALPGKDQPLTQPALYVTARISEERAVEFGNRLQDLAEEFLAAEDDSAPTVFGMTTAVFLTDIPTRGTVR